MQNYGKMLKNKRGWIKVVEAFVSILLIAGVLLVLINQRETKKENNEEIYAKENFVLREIELNKTLRNEILGLEPLPVEFENLSNALKTKISGVESYLECNAKICESNATCDIGVYINKSVYVKSVFISSNTTKYSPRQLKLFCWEK